MDEQVHMLTAEKQKLETEQWSSQQRIKVCFSKCKSIYCSQEKITHPMHSKSAKLLLYGGFYSETFWPVPLLFIPH